MKTNQRKTKKQKKNVPAKEDKTRFEGTFEQLIDIVAPPIKPEQIRKNDRRENNK